MKPIKLTLVANTRLRLGLIPWVFSISVLGILVSSSACSGTPEKDPKERQSGASSAGTPLPTGTQSAKPGSSSAGPSSSGEIASASKRFKGTFKARKRRVAPQSTAEDDVWKRDDGKLGSGPGEIEIVVGSNGDISGELRGPWGTLDLNGVTEGDGVYASLRSRADSPSVGAHGGFGGTLDGRLSATGVDVSMRVTSGDAVLAREGEAQLTPIR